MNIILIAIDTLRADHLSCYRYFRRTSPNIDALAEEGILFENCISECSHTVPAFTSMVTGLSPLTHGVVATNWCLPNENINLLDDNIPTLAECLQELGYVTCAVDNLIHTMAFHPKWFARGYEFCINYAVKYLSGKNRADRVNARALSWLRKYARDVEKFFLFIHYWDPHQPYSPPDPYSSMFPLEDPAAPVKRLRNGVEFVPRWGAVEKLDEGARSSISRYDGEIAFVDAHVGQLVCLLRDLRIYEETLIIVTADHGDDMIEHNCKFEHREVYDCCIRVPLIYKPPAGLGLGKGVRIAALVQHQDLMPTMLELVGAREVPRMDGFSTKPLMTGEESSLRDESFSTGVWIFDSNDGNWKSAEMCVRTAEWKFIRRADISHIANSIPADERKTRKELIGLFRRQPEPFMALPSRELINLREDREEQFNVVKSYPNVASRLEEKLRPWTESRLFLRKG